MASEKELKTYLWGYHPVEEALLRGTRTLGTLYLARRADSVRTRRLVSLAKERGLKIRRVEARTLERLSSGKSHQGVVATVEAVPARDLEEILRGTAGLKNVLLLVLDGVQDPHNLGAAVRNACLTGAAAVVLPRDRTAGVTPAVEKVAAGGLEHVPVVRVGNLAAALRKMKEAGFWIAGADAAGDTELPDADLGGRTAIVIGEEHRGLRRLTREHCDLLVRIPGTGLIDSYNLGVAAGLMLFFAFLQQRTHPPPSPGQGAG